MLRESLEAHQPDDALSFEFVIPDANYALDNLVLNGSVSNVEYSFEIDPDGSHRHTVAGLVPPYQSVGGYQPNGFGGQLQPDSAVPSLRCGVA